MVEMRREALKEFTGREVIVVSKKQPYMKFPGYGEMSLRILPDGSTFIVLPHIDPIKGGMKKVKYGILISPNCDEISLHMICTLRDGTVRKSEEGRLIFYPKRVEYLSLFRGSFDAALKITHHDNILSPTALISHPGKYPGSKRVNPKNLEMIIPKCDVDLFEFLGDWYYEKRGTRSKDESVTHIRSAFQYLKEISSAMLHLHQSGYLYCDLKPENVMLKKLPNGSITAKLIDFDFLVSDKIRVKRFTTSYYPVEALFNLTKSH
jgi:serine/threonine protein kinase